MINQPLLLILITCTVRSLAVQLYVSSDSQSHQCDNLTCVDCKCATLSEYARDITLDNLRLTFLSGEHHLSTNINFTNSHDIVLEKADPSTVAEVVCQQESAGLLFENLTNLSISGLKFTRCGRNHTVDSHPHFSQVMAAVMLSHVTNFSLSEVTVQLSTGYGMFMSHVHGSSSIHGCIFQNNTGTSPTSEGGNAVLTYHQCDASVTDMPANVVIEKSAFLNGRSCYYASGLIVFIVQCSSIQVGILESVFQNNRATCQSDCVDGLREGPYGGNVALTVLSQQHSMKGHKVKVAIIRVIQTNITQGKACFGGGLSVNINRYAFENVSILNTIFRENIGGAAYVQLGSHNAVRSSHAIKNTLTIEKCSFVQNRLTRHHAAAAGVALTLASQSISTQHSSLTSTLLTNCDFRDNHAEPATSENPMLAEGVSAVLHASHILGRLTITNCTFEDNGASAVRAVRSILTFSGDTFISNNSGHKGGGVVLLEASYMVLTPNTTLTISDNYAGYVGGGIFVEEQCAQSSAPCFYQVGLDDNRPVKSAREALEGVKVRLINNTALYSGSQIYGGRVETCTAQYKSRNLFRQLFELVNADSNDMSVISSEPDSIYFCDDGVSVDSSLRVQEVYNGEHFHISLLLQGQCDGVTPGNVEFTVKGEGVVKETSTKTQAVPRECSNHSAVIYTNRTTEVLEIRLKHSDQCQQGVKNISLLIKILPPPLGFWYTRKENRPYDCTEDFDKNNSGIECILFKYNNHGIIRRKPPWWIGYVTNVSNQSIVLYYSCPLSYCKSYPVNIITSSDKFEQDIQCTGNRTGILCGQCIENFSLSIGTSKCLDCTHITIPTTIAISFGLFLLGLILILGLLISDLTITQGTMNEFLFYANIVYLYWHVLFPFIPLKKSKANRSAVAFLFLVISAINLIFGCNCCFYNGLDVIGRTWVQFAVVASLWIMAGIIIWASRRFAWVGKLTRHNAIQVLATIFALSNTSTSLGILHTISAACLSYPGSTGCHAVLLFDGNVRYLSGRHIPLFITSCIFAVVSIGFTLILVFVQPLQRYSHLCPLWWVNKLKPLLDAYTCPHIIKPRCRFWNGYLLLIRSVIYVVSTTSVGHDNRKFLDVLSLACLVTLATSLMFGGVYTKLRLNVISSLHIINLGLLSVIVRDLYQPLQNHGHSTYSRTSIFTISSVSVSLATLTFFITVCCHLYWRLRQSGMLWKLCALMSYCRKKRLGKWNRREEWRQSVVESDSGGVQEDEPLLATASISTSDLEISHTSHPPLSRLNYREPQLLDFDST